MIVCLQPLYLCNVIIVLFWEFRITIFIYCYQIEVILFWTMMTIDPNLLKRHEIYDICVPPLLDHALVSIN